MTFFSPAVNASVQNTLNRTVSSFAGSNVAECYNSTKNLLDNAFINSRFHVSGDFKQEQDAQVAFSCIQDSQQSAELMNKLASQMKAELTQSLEEGISVGNTSINLSSQQIQNIVENNVKLSNDQSCNAVIDNSSVLRLVNSEVSIGSCNEAVVAANERACNNGRNNAVELALAGKDALATVALEQAQPNCDALKTCADRVGNFLQSQGIRFDGKCDQVSSIAANITNDIVAIQEADQSIERTNVLSNIVVWIVIGVAVVALIGGIVGFLRYQASKKAKEEKALQVQLQRNSQGYQQQFASSRQPAFATQGLLPTQQVY